MGSLMVLIDGLGDDPIPALGGKTPLELARPKGWQYLADCGTQAQVSICEKDLVPESCSCILRLLGVAKKDIPSNRAYLELLAHNRDISEYEMVLRCNLVAVDKDQHLVAFNGQGLSPQEMAECAAACEGILQEIEFIHLSEYRNLLIMDKKASLLDCRVPPPHESLGGRMPQLLEGINKSLAVSFFLKEAKRRLAPFSREGLHYELYPWGPSARQLLPSFTSLHGLKGGMVCKAEIVLGMARALGMQVQVPSGATGDVDTNIGAKAKATLELLQTCDFVMAHFNGTDEAAHRYDYREKAAFIEKIDQEFLQPILEKVTDPLRILICGDHVTSSVTGKHGPGPVPVVAAAINSSKDILTIDNYQDILKFMMRE